MCTVAVSWPGSQGAEAGAPEPDPGPASRDRAGLAVVWLELHPPAAHKPNASRHWSGTTATRAPPCSASVRTKDYSVLSAGRRFGNPSRGNWSSWKVTISAIAPPVMRRTSSVSGRYAFSRSCHR